MLRVDQDDAKRDLMEQIRIGLLQMSYSAQLIEVNSVSLQKKNVNVAAKRRGKKAVKLNERQTDETVNVAQHENRKCECVVCPHIFGDLSDPLKHEEWVQCVSCSVGWQRELQ